MHATLRDANPPLTRSVEDYLKAIYHLSNQGGFAATSDIAAMLEVAPPSVSGMVKRLSEAERIEHVLSDELIDRMAGALGNPQYDPHGDPIPTATGEIEEAELVSLADAGVGTKLELRQVGTQDPARLRYFAEQGLTPGVLLTVTDRQPFNGPTTIGLVPSGDPRVVGRELALLLWCREVPVTDDGYASR